MRRRDRTADRPPASMRVSERDGVLEITWMWFRLAWWVGLLGLGALYPAVQASLAGRWLLSGFLLVFGLVMISFCFGRTVIRLEGDTVRVRHRPIPWPGRRVSIAGAERIFHRRTVIGFGRRKTTRFVVCARISANRVVEIHGFPIPDEAQFAVEAIERHRLR